MFDIRTNSYTTEADTVSSDFWETNQLVVASLETLRLDRGGRHERFFDASPWDLLIVDEAHHLNADKDSGHTLGYRFAQRLVKDEKVGSILFFTGTPHRGKDFGFLSLLQLLRADLFDPRKTFKEQLPRLREAMIRNNKQCVTDLQGRRLFKKPCVTSETYEYSPEERHFYEMLTEFIGTGKAYASTLGTSRSRVVVLVLITMQKLASSSVAAIRRSLSKRRNRVVEQRETLEKATRLREERLKAITRDYENIVNDGDYDELSEFEEDFAFETAGSRLMEDEEHLLRELLAAADCVRRETKIEKILDLVESRFSERSVLFFSEYKATQSLLMSELIRRFGDESVAFINGPGRADGVVGSDGQERSIRMEKSDAAERFNNGQVRFLISTEAGGEGIDLQEQCHSLIHADLPWNPMRLHQRVGRLNRYGQKKRVDVITLRNPDTIEARIWDKLNNKISKIMEAIGSVMEEPEDLLQMVLGMESPKKYNELFGQATMVPEESLSRWFDKEAGTFGGLDVIETVKEIVGNVEKFDYHAVGKEIPSVDLPDLRPFVELMLIRNHRRPRRGEDGSLTFRTPEAWSNEVGVRSTYEGLIFDRRGQGKDAVQRVVGVGHKIVDLAVRQALDESVCVASVTSVLLDRPIIVTRVIDRVTGGSSPITNVIVGVERAEDDDKWKILRDWELLGRLNEVVKDVAGLRTSCQPPEDRREVEVALEQVVAVVKAEVPGLNTGFKVPSVEVIAVLWPGLAIEGTAQSGQKTGQ